AASGGLSELLGEDLLGVDERFLTLGLRAAAEAEWQRTGASARRALESYARGVNAAIEADGSLKRPLELQLLRVRPAVWTPVDSLAIGKLFAWRLGENHNAELLRYTLIGQLGPRFAELLGPMPESASAIVPREVHTPDAETTQAAAHLPPGLEWLSSDRHAGSNSWVVGGSRSATGKPLLANDPHLAIEMPSTWWEVHLATRDGLNVSGATIPGVPFVIIGHNERIAWGLTNS